MSRSEESLIHLEMYKLKEDAEDYGLADEKFDLDTFKKRLKFVAVRYDERDEGDSLEFDMIGVHPSFANAIRRIILSEVPSMAIDRVHMYMNTSVIPDEVLAHRLGLLPLKADPRNFEYHTGDWDNSTENDSLEFELKVKCTQRKDVKAAANTESQCRYNKVYTNHIKWVPKGQQSEIYNEKDIGCILDNILITQLRPGHEIELRMIAVKGIGKDHAKFMPVSVASYRLLPKLRLNREISGPDAQLLQKCFAPGVIEVDKEGRAQIKNARYDNCNRNVFHYPQLHDAVTMSRVRDHYIFTIESIGALKPDVIVVEALKILKAKCRKFIEEINIAK